MGFFKKIFGTKHDTIPASGPDTVRVDELPEVPPGEALRAQRQAEKKFDPAKRIVNMSRAEIIAGIDEMEKTDKEKANELRRALGIPEKP